MCQRWWKKASVYLQRKPAACLTGRRSTALFLQSFPFLRVLCLRDIIKPYSFLLASVSMSRLILNARWWITFVMNSIRLVTWEAVRAVEFLLTCKCFSLSELRFLLTEWKYGHVYFNSLLKPIFYDMVLGDGNCVLHLKIIFGTCWNLIGYLACLSFLWNF